MLCQNYEIIFICRKDVEKMKKKKPTGHTAKQQGFPSSRAVCRSASCSAVQMQAQTYLYSCQLLIEISFSERLHIARINALARRAFVISGML